MLRKLGGWPWFAGVLLVVACGEGTSGPSEGIPNADGNPSSRGAQGGAGGAATALHEGANGGSRSMPPIGNATGGVVGIGNPGVVGGVSAGSNDTKEPSGDSLGAGGEADESEVLELPPGWNPGGSLSPIAWYVASSSDYQVVSGGTATWIDRQGNDHNLTQPTSWAQPQLVATGWNGTQPTLRFNGGNLLRLDGWSQSPMGTNAGFTVLAVIRSAAPQHAGIAAWWSEWGDGVWASVRSTSGLTLLDYHRLDDATTTQMYAGNQDLGTGGHVVAWRFSPSTHSVSLTVDGAHAVSTPQPPIGNITPMPLIVGALSPLPTGFFQGDISELVIVGTAISDEQVQNFTEYARNTWSGLPTSAGSGPCIKADGQPSPDTIRCDDGNPDTVGDHCSAGSCVGVVPGPGSPKDLSPIAWYHAGAPEVVITYDGVSTWFDRSPEHRDLLNGYWGRPTLVADGWNDNDGVAEVGDKPTVRFGGAHALKRQGWTGQPTGVESAFTVLAVLRPATSQDSGVVSWWHPNAYGRAALQIKASGGTSALDLLRVDTSLVTQEAVGTIDLGNARHAVAWRYGNGTAKLTVDGVTQTRPHSPIGLLPPDDWFLMGVASGFPTGVFSGDISELAVIPRSVSDSEVANFTAYAQAEWGGLTIACTPDCAEKALGDADGCGGTCGCDLSAPFDAPVAAFTGSMDADGLTFSADGRTAYISGAGPGNRDIYVATRSSLEETFGTPELVTAINTSAIERAPSLSPDGKLYFTKQPIAMFDIGRAVGTAPLFTGAEVVPAPISSSQQDEDPFWWGNDTLYFVSEVDNGGAHRDIWVATLNGTTFLPPTKVQGQDLNSSTEEFRPVLSPDGLTLYFASKRFGIGNDTQGDVWMARRASTEAPFLPPINLWGMNSTGTDHPVTVADNGCTLYFASNEETGLGGSQNLRLYKATRGVSTPAQVTLRLNILGQGSVTTPPFNCGAGNTGACAASAPPDTTMVLTASGLAQWTGSCTGQGGHPSTDGVVVFSQNAVCTIKFPGGNPVGQGGLCSLSMDCEQGLACVNNTCSGCAPGVCNASCPCGPGGGPCGDDTHCQSGLSCTNGTCVCPPGGCGVGQDQCDDDSDCPEGLACLEDFGPHFGLPRGTNVCGKPNCATRFLELGCGFEDAPCGPICDPAIGCSTNADCPAGEVCGIGLGPSLGLITANACVPPICVSDPVAAGCGENSLCGKCPCTSTCDSKQCGDNPSNGCDGRCRGFCDTREPGCTADADCPPGNACFFGGGPLIGLPEGTNVCLPSKCLDPNPARKPCATTESECGQCTEPPDDVCEDRECGVDPAYGVQCGSSCSQGLSCVAGKCVQSFTTHDLELPTISPHTLDQHLVLPQETRADLRITVPGALEGSFGVNSRGRATYRVPIAGPPARAGMEPSIALEFVNGAPNGLVGQGWSIDGLSSISRCPTIAAMNQAAGPNGSFVPWVKPVEYNDSDQLCLDGTPLVLVPNSAPSFTPGAEYATEIDSFSKVVAVSDGVRLSFKVFKKDGRIFYYGGALNSEVHRQRDTRLVRAWALRRIEDRVGNFVEYKYGKFVEDGHRVDEIGDDQTVEFWPAEIAYGGLIKNGVRVVEPRRALVFHYDDGRNDYMEGFSRGGARLARTKLLVRIEAQIGGKLVRSYRLGYENAPAGAPISGLLGVKRVREIEECATKGAVLQCKRPTIFDYLNEQGLRAAAGGTAVTEESHVGLNARTDLVVLDWNGDGRDDILAAGNRIFEQGQADQQPLLIATDNPAARYTRVIARLGSEPCFSQNSIFDFNGDGRDDVFDTCNADIYLSTGNPGEPFVRDTTESSTNLGGQRPFLADLNGDGLKDLFVCGPPGHPDLVSYRLGRLGDGNDGAPFSEERGFDAQGELLFAWGECVGGYESATGHAAPILVVDIDGDGADDILMGKGAQNRPTPWARYVARPDGTAEWRPLDSIPHELELTVRSGASLSTPSFRYGLMHFIDANGDGLKDIFGIVAEDFTIREQAVRFDLITYTNLGGTFDEGHNAYYCTPGSSQAICRSLVSATIGAVPYSIGGALTADYTGDGRDDVMRMYPGEPSSLWQLDVGAITDPRIEGPRGALPVLIPDSALLVNGSSSQFVPRPLTTPMVKNVANQPDLSSPITALADADGDGSQDVLMVNSDGDLVVMPARFGREHLLSRVTDGMGKQVTVDYQTSRPYSDGTHPVFRSALDSGMNTCLDEDSLVLCASRESVGPLVSHYVIRKEEEGVFRPDRSFVLRYERAFQGLYGRGFLGFDRRIIEERAPDAVLIERNEIFEHNSGLNLEFNFYPRAGLEEKRVVTTPLADSDLSAQATFRRVTTDNSWGEVDQLNISSKGRPFPSLRHSITRVEEVEANGTPHRVSFQRTDYHPPDPYGNIIHKETTVQDDEGIVSFTKYDAGFDIRDGDPWLIGLLERVQTMDDRLRDGEPAVARTNMYEFDELGLIRRSIREPDEDTEASEAKGLRQETVYERNPSDPFQVVRKITTSGDWVDESGEPVHGTRVTSIEYDDETMFPRHVYRHHGEDECSFESSHTTECQTTDVSYDLRDGTLILRVDPTGVGERMQYDPFGRLTIYESAADTVRISYQDSEVVPSPIFPVHAKMQITGTSEKTGASSTRRVDSLGRTVQTQKLGIDRAIVAQEIEYLTGRLVSRVSRPHLPDDDSQGATQYRYDARFRPFDVIFQDSTFVAFQYAPTALLVGNVSGESGETTAKAVIDQNGRRTLTLSDARGIASRRIDPKGNPVRYEITAFDQLARVVEPIAGEADHVTRIVADKIGRTIVHEDEDSGTTSTGYTAFDSVAMSVDNLDRRTNFVYDDLGRLERIDSSTSGASTHFAYDGPGENTIGRLVETVSQDGVVESYTFESPPAGDDPLENRAFLESVERIIADTPFTTSFRYNDKNQLERVTYPPTATSTGNEAFRVHYGYDGAGNLTCVSANEVPTPADCGSNRFWKLEEAFQGYRLQEESFGNGVTTSYGYDDANGYLRSLNTAHGQTNHQSITYPLYDDKGNLRRRVQTFRTVNGDTTTADERFSYDELDRLTDVVLLNGAAPTPTQQLGYADNGNIVEKTDVGDYDYGRRSGDPLRAPHAVRRILRDDVEVSKFTYDGVGNMTKREGEGVEGGVQTFDYNWFNLPSTVVVGPDAPGVAGSKEIHYDYDARMRRVHATIEADGTEGFEGRRFYAGGFYERVEGEDVAGVFTHHLYKVFAGGRQIAQVQREVRSGASVETRRYIHADHQGSSQVFTDEEGDLAHLQRFDAFGNPSSPASGSSDPTARNIRAGYTGHETDVETGLVNMRGRLYDPRLARFMQADPIVDFSSLQQLNRYSYVLNNPLNLVDPSGFDEGDETDSEDITVEDDTTGMDTVVTVEDADGNTMETFEFGPIVGDAPDPTPTSEDTPAEEPPSAIEIAEICIEGDPDAGGVNTPVTESGGDTTHDGEENEDESGNPDDADMGDDEEAENPQQDELECNMESEGEGAGTGASPQNPPNPNPSKGGKQNNAPSFKDMNEIVGEGLGIADTVAGLEELMGGQPPHDLVPALDVLQVLGMGTDAIAIVTADDPEEAMKAALDLGFGVVGYCYPGLGQVLLIYDVIDLTVGWQDGSVGTNQGPSGAMGASGHQPSGSSGGAGPK
jgi:RHS repeat-associated protein